MPRKQRNRCIGAFPDYWCFLPEDAKDQACDVILSLDEYESIRLIDYEGMTQEQCARQMGVARTTVTAIYESARKKLALSIVEGKRLLISGGKYQLSEEKARPVIVEKGQDIMRIGVTYDQGQIFQHFGHTEQFKLYDVEDGRIVSEQIVDTNGQGHGALAGFLKQCQADALICGGIGMGAQMALQEAGIRLYGGVQGSADEAAKALAEGRLQFDPDAHCDHHDGEHGEGRHCGHHEEGHSCGSHGCHE